MKLAAGKKRRWRISVFFTRPRKVFFTKTNVKTNKNEYNENDQNDENGKNDFRFEAKSFKFEVAGLFQRWRVHIRAEKK